MPPNLRSTTSAVPNKEMEEYFTRYLLSYYTGCTILSASGRQGQE